MRKGLVALVLVGAAFVGGAAINGPVPPWARDLLAKTGRPRGSIVALPATATSPAAGADSSQSARASGAISSVGRSRRSDGRGLGATRRRR